MNGESEVNGDKCITEKIRSDPHTVTFLCAASASSRACLRRTSQSLREGRNICPIFG